MTRAELERRLFILRDVVTEQRGDYANSVWWWRRRHVERYNLIVTTIDTLISAVRQAG